MICNRRSCLLLKLLTFLQIYFHVFDVVQTLPAGRVTILLDNVYNRVGTTKNNVCCSGSRNITTGLCEKQCRIFVHFCINPGNGYPHHCLMGRRKTMIFNTNSVKFPTDGSNVTRHRNRDLIDNTIPLEDFNNVLRFPIREALRDEV